MSTHPLKVAMLFGILVIGCAQRRADVYQGDAGLQPSAEEQAKMLQIGCEKGGNMWDGKQCMMPLAFCQTHSGYKMQNGKCLSPQATCEQKGDGSMWVEGHCLAAHDACGRLAADGYEWSQGKCLAPKEACIQRGFGSKWDDVNHCQTKSFLEQCQDPAAPPSFQQSISVLKALAESSGCLETREWLSKTTDLNISAADQTQQFQELALLQEFTQLEHLTLTNQWVRRSAPLKALVRLKTLDIQRNQLEDLEGLRLLTDLQELHVADNVITDVSPLKDLKKLTLVSLSNNRLSDIVALADLTALTTLYLNGNAISNLAPLRSLNALESLQVDNTPLANGQIKKDFNNCPTNNTSQVLAAFCLQ